MAAQKVALITAGTAGLGAQIARVLAPDYRLVRHATEYNTWRPELNAFLGHQLCQQSDTGSGIGR